MKHLHLAGLAAQHAVKWHASAAEVHNIRIVGLVALLFAVVGLIRTVVKGRRASEVAVAERAVRTEELRQTGREWLAANTTYGDAE